MNMLSSLDQDFEESTVKRLINLSEKKQVIVFTHRLSMLTLLKSLADSKNIDNDVVCLRSEIWGIGEPGDTPIYAKATKQALNTLANERLDNAKKVLNNIGSEKYHESAKAMCSDIRILIERIVEYDLLSD